MDSEPEVPAPRIARPGRDSFAYDGADSGSTFNALVVAGTADSEREAIEAVECAGGRVLARLSWQDAARALGDQAVLESIMVEAEGVEADLLEAILPRIDTLARATKARVVIALSNEQIDLVAAQLFGTHIQLLCTPTLSQRVGALALSITGGKARMHEAAREGEAERLRRLNEEVARIAQTLARLTRREDLMPPIGRSDVFGDRRTGYGAEPADGSTAIDPQDVRQAIRSRRLRDQYFERGLFEDPAWDMLLDLFAAELEARQVSVSSLCIAAAVAPTTALRWIGRMSDAGLFERRPDPFDRRRAFMALSDKAREGMRRYCGAVKAMGLGIA